MTPHLFYVSHAADEILALAGHVVVLDRGRVAAEGDPSRLAAEGWIKAPTPLLASGFQGRMGSGRNGEGFAAWPDGYRMAGKV